MAKVDFRLMTHRSVLALGVALAFVVVRAWSVNAFGAPARSMQSPTATLSGTVVDERDAVVPEVKITVTNADTSLRRSVMTSREGYFSVTLLPPGRYAVSAQYQGFTTAEVRNLRLNVGDQLARHCARVHRSWDYKQPGLR
jgi:Carboxypeptidase regulatory-like domain